jgi:predicted nuclease with TOPRIM domain
MTFTVKDFHDLVGLLEQHPEWRAELRRLVLTEELLALPQVVRELAEAQRRTEQRVEELAEAQRRTEQRVEELAEAQRRTEQRVEELAEAQRRTEQRVEELAEAQRRTEQQIVELIAAQRRTEQRVSRLQDDVGELKGIVLEERYHKRAPSYFSRLLRQTHVVSGNELATLLGDAVGSGLLSEEGSIEIGWADVVVRGQRREDSAEIYLVVEVSWGVGTGDVERAARRAALLAQTGVQTLPVVAGDHITDEAAELCRAMRVWQVFDGRTTSPNDHSGS